MFSQIVMRAVTTRSYSFK